MSTANYAEPFADALREQYLPSDGRPGFVQWTVDAGDDASWDTGTLLLTVFDGDGYPTWTAVYAEPKALLREFTDPTQGNAREPEHAPRFLQLVGR